MRFRFLENSMRQKAIPVHFLFAKALQLNGIFTSIVMNLPQAGFNDIRDIHAGKLPEELNFDLSVVE